MVAVDKLEPLVEDFLYNLGQVASEVIQADHDAYIDTPGEILVRPAGLAPEDQQEDRVLAKDAELDDWKHLVLGILDKTHKKLVEDINRLDVFDLD
jgi:hypothetical protein